MEAQLNKKTVFVAGSMNIKHLDEQVKKRLQNIVQQELEIVVGDAEGADSSIQTYLMEIGAIRMTVYCSGERPRNNIGSWPIRAIHTDHNPGTRAFFTAKDVAMADVAHYGLMIWDTKSTGTLTNVLELLRRKKKALVFVNKSRTFIEVKDVPGLEKLLTHMSMQSRMKAEQKIFLSKQVTLLKSAGSAREESSNCSSSNEEKQDKQRGQQLGLI